jgi:hypothetical protein
MSTFAPSASPQVTPYDPSKHVNYSIGMVLGVDDFNQEFTYLDGRNRRIVRDLLGYGVVAGLQVAVDVDAVRGPRVQVAPGEAVSPSGRLLCVSPAQCAYLNEWLAANPDEIDALGSPPPSAVALAVVACWNEVATDEVPIPGEPCRSDSELMAASRLQDSFSLQLRTAAPAQIEEQTVREFVAWARRIPLSGGSGAGGIDGFMASLRAAAGLTGSSRSSPPSPPSSPPDPLAFLSHPPPPGLVIPRDGAPSYLAALARFWTSELRPRLRSPAGGAECDCAGGPGSLDPDADCVTLAQLAVPIVRDALSGAVRVSDQAPVHVDESARATLLDARFLQEWMLTSEPPATLVATGHVGADGRILAQTGGLTAKALSSTVFLLGFAGFDPGRDRVVLGHAVSRLADPAPSTFEVISSADPGLPPLLGSPPATGVAVRVRRSDGSAPPDGFMVRIDQLGGSS